MSTALDTRQIELLMLGMLLHIPDSIYEIADDLLPEHFATKDTQQGYTKARDLAVEGNLTMVNFAKSFSDGLWKHDDIAGLSELYTKSGYVTPKSLAQEIRNGAILRQAVSIGRRIQVEKDPEQLQILHAELGNALDVTHGKPFDLTWENGKEFIEYLEQGQGRPRGIMTGFRFLDDLTAGFGPGELCVFGAASGTGKTTWALDVAWNVSAIHPVAFMSVEMDRAALRDKLYSLVSGVETEKFRRGTMTDSDWPMLVEALGRIEQRRLILDFHSRELHNLVLRSRRMVAQHDVRLIVIDYCQRIQAQHERGSNREREIATVAQTIKNLSLDLKIPIILLSQINRAGEAEAEPKKYHLRESGVIEQEADTILLAWRDFHGGTDCNFKLDKNRPMRRLGKFCLAFDRYRDSYNPQPLSEYNLVKKGEEEGTGHDAEDHGIRAEGKEDVDF